MTWQAKPYAPAAVNAADAHLSKDPVMAGLITDFGGPLEEESARRPAEVYSALLRSITGQQLSVKAAQAIYGRLIERFGGRPPTPEALLADDPEAMRDLVAVKGIGEWTAHMFLMFTLHRQDILATGDQGIRNALVRAYGLDAVPKPDAMIELAEPWRPYRTRACVYLWRSLDNEPI